MHTMIYWDKWIYIGINDIYLDKWITVEIKGKGLDKVI